MHKQPSFVAVFGALALFIAVACGGSDSAPSTGSGADAARADASTNANDVIKDAGKRVGSGRSTRADGDSDAGPTANTGSSAADSGASTFEKLAGAYCDKLVQCTPFGFERSYESGDDCRRRRMQLYAFWSKLPDTGWTAEVEDACYKAVYGLSCREFVDDNGQKACAPKGKRKDGDPCNAREQCASRFCDSDGYACGTCKKAPEEGASCRIDDDCPDENACLCDNGTPRCKSPRCRRLRDAEETCAADTPCGPGLNCKDGRCQVAPDKVGAECNPAQGLLCDTVSAGLVCTSSGCAKLKAADVCSPTEYCKDRKTSCEISKDSASAACVAKPADTGACDLASGQSCRFPAVCSSGKCQLPGASPLCPSK
jgi:hypothetical protein